MPAASSPSDFPIFNGNTFQSSVYVAINMQSILYGIELVLYFKTLHVLLTDRGARKKSNIFYVFFSTMMVALITIWLSTNAYFAQKMWILERNYPGGPNAYWHKNISVWYADFAGVAVIVLQLMTDGLMIYRCRIVWNSYRVIIIPVILWFGTLGLGIVVLYTSSVPGADYLTGVAAQMALIFCVVAVFLNTTLTCLICYRMVRHGRTVQEYLGHEYASLYFAIVTMIVESVFPYTIFGIAFVVAMGVGSPTAIAFLSLYFLMMTISPQMLILRVIVGRAWDKDTFNPSVSKVKFNPGSTALESQYSASSGREGSVHVRTLPNVFHPDGLEKV